MIKTEITHAPVTVHQLKVDGRKITKSMVQQIPQADPEEFFQHYTENAEVLLGHVRYTWKRCGVHDGFAHVLWVRSGELVRSAVSGHYAHDGYCERLEEWLTEAETPEEKERVEKNIREARCRSLILKAVRERQIYL